ncbi:MAG: hypothetical protein D6728_20695 [Cyanobacteria bacterium J055]|nr:MAG: hypothetical protein D6728_20695 [Cyanobacteria bacterium J055]
MNSGLKGFTEIPRNFWENDPDLWENSPKVVFRTTDKLVGFPPSPSDREWGIFLPSGHLGFGVRGGL